jgi:cation:H+ antiporter
MTYVLLIFGLVITVLGSGWLVDGASDLAKRLNISDLIIGLTIVAFGTSTPELTVSVYAAMSGSTEIAIGNILGSNIFNVFVILGLAAIIYPVTVQKNSVWIEIPLSLLAAVVVGICANDMIIDGAATSQLSRIDGIMLLLFFVVFMYYTIFAAKANPEETNLEFKPMPLWKAILFISLGLVALFYGGKFMVDGAVEMARTFGISESVIGLTIVAAGTSTPELATSCMAAYKKNSDIALGNVVGSNIFNIFFILGTSASVRALPFRESSMVDIFMTIFASLIMFTFVFTGKGRSINRVEGVILIIIYIVYVVYLLTSQAAA